MTTMDREAALPYVRVVLDDALSDGANMKPDARLVGWQCGFEPMFVAVQSYLPGCTLTDDEAVGIAADYLAEKGWFSDPADSLPDYIL